MSNPEIIQPMRSARYNSTFPGYPLSMNFGLGLPPTKDNAVAPNSQELFQSVLFQLLHNFSISW